MKFILNEKTNQWICVIPFPKDKMPFLVEFPNDDHLASDDSASLTHSALLSSYELDNITYPSVTPEKKFVCVADYKENHVTIATQPKDFLYWSPMATGKKKGSLPFYTDLLEGRIDDILKNNDQGQICMEAPCPRTIFLWPYDYVKKTYPYLMLAKKTWVEKTVIDEGIVEILETKKEMKQKSKL